MICFGNSFRFIWKWITILGNVWNFVRMPFFPECVFFSSLFVVYLMFSPLPRSFHLLFPPPELRGIASKTNKSFVLCWSLYQMKVVWFWLHFTAFPAVLCLWSVFSAEKENVFGCHCHFLSFNFAAIQVFPLKVDRYDGKKAQWRWRRQQQQHSWRHQFKFWMPRR